MKIEYEKNQGFLLIESDEETRLSFANILQNTETKILLVLLWRGLEITPLLGVPEAGKLALAERLKG